VKLFILDRRSVLPLYYQIQQRLLADIRSGTVKPGESVPSELELARKLGVSRMTARQALKSLCDLGVAYSQRGKGTFVSPYKLDKGFRQALSFSESMRARGLRPGSKLLSLETILPNAEVAGALEIRSGEKVLRLRRVRTANGVPMGVECSYLPVRLYPDLQQKFDPGTSLYKALAELYGVHIEMAEEVAEAGLADARQARLLGVSAMSAVFVFSRTSFVHSGQPVEYVRSIYRGDRYKIVNRLSQNHRGNSGRGKS
jgi:GntR family transcriptional regulator